MPSCGSEELGNLESKVGKTELACMDSARESGRGAELIVRSYTIEGDPITSYWRVTPDGSTEAYQDSTKDAFGDQKWSFAVCDDPEPVIELAC